MDEVAITDESLIPFDVAHSTLPGSPTRHQLRHWWKLGIVVRANDEKSRVRLECCRIGGRPFTSKEAFQRFLEKTNQ